MQTPTADFELRAAADGFDYVIGCDEVGRGAIAGPVVACACVLNKEFLSQNYPWKKYVRDSKTLLEKKREEISPLIQEQSLIFSLGIVESDVIDKENIHNASLNAMKQAVEQVLTSLGSRGVNSSKILLLIDGRFNIWGLDPAVRQQPVIDGDAKVLSIAAASIIAKVYRDALMRELDEKLEQYMFKANKGYGTKGHFAAIIKHGLTPEHRRTFIQS